MQATGRPASASNSEAVPGGANCGVYFRVPWTDVWSIIGAWQGGGGPDCDNAKGGEGAVLRARNPRTDKASAVLLWGTGSGPGGGQGAEAYGCWNPVEYCTPDDWKVRYYAHTDT